MNNLKESLDAGIARWNLLEHPFYRAWNNGTLPVPKLRRYASEYGSFIGTIAECWRAVGEESTAAEEDIHFTMWQDFGKSIAANAVGSALPATKALVRRSRASATAPAIALGALYAFEAQQPRTTASKQEGLQQFYADLGANDTYFRVHMNEEDEANILLRKMETLGVVDQQKGVAACEEMSHSLWDALTAIDEAT